MTTWPFDRDAWGVEDPQQPTVLKAEPRMKSGQLLACSVSLVVAGLLFTRGFIGFTPGRPLFIILGLILALSATVGLAVDNVDVRRTKERPAEVLAAELTRARRYGHSLCLLALDCEGGRAEQAIKHLRSCDRAWHRDGSLWMLLPETDHVGMAGFLVRIHDVVGGCQVRGAVFPQDALTAEGLEEALVVVDAGLGSPDGGGSRRTPSIDASVEEG